MTSRSATACGRALAVVLGLVGAAGLCVAGWIIFYSGGKAEREPIEQKPKDSAFPLKKSLPPEVEIQHEPLPAEAVATPQATVRSLLDILERQNAGQLHAIDATSAFPASFAFLDNRWTLYRLKDSLRTIPP